MTIAIGWRIWEVDNDGRLRSGFARYASTQPANRWRGSTETAICPQSPTHHPPVPNCKCGLYYWPNVELCVTTAEVSQAPVVGAVIVGGNPLDDPDIPHARRARSLTLTRLWARPESYDQITPPPGIPVERDYTRLVNPRFLSQFRAMAKDNPDARFIAESWQEKRTAADRERNPT